MPNVFNPEWEAELVYELEPGAAVSPLHVHHANDEMLLVLYGVASVRTPDQERELGQGELVAFLAGPEGLPPRGRGSALGR